MHKPESVLENEMHKILWDFEIQTDHLILTRWPPAVIIDKKGSYRKLDFAVQADHRMKIKESEKSVKYLELTR